MLKKRWHAYIPVVLAFLPSCQRQVDTAEEQQAIRAVIEAEKKGYFDKNLEAMAVTWAQTPSSVKMFLLRDGEVDLFGWPRINDRSKQEIAVVDSLQNVRLEYSDFQFHIYPTSAWAIFKANGHWSRAGQEEQAQQTRVMAFEKVEGKWKITLMAIYAVPSEKR